MNLIKFIKVFSATKLIIFNLSAKKEIYGGWSTDFNFITDKEKYINLKVLSACQIGDYVQVLVIEERGEA